MELQPRYCREVQDAHRGTAAERNGKSSGTVVVEWLNVSGGLDADPDWTSLREEITRSGDTWVGVSAQLIGVEGGKVLVTVPGVGAGIVGMGLKKIDPQRYASLSHPGDGFSFDIFTQIARAVRAGGPALGGQRPNRVIAAGESQSAFALTTYVNGVQPLTLAFDGFFVHSRGAAGLPLVAPGEPADIAKSIGNITTIFRTDTTVPIMDIQSETDIASLLNSRDARQPDTNTFRLWEVAGTAHADRHLMGTTADAVNCGAPVNDGPLHIVAKASLHALKTWMQTGTPPAPAPRVTIDSKGAIARNADGIALGGIRTPPVDVATIVLSGVPGPNPAIICILLGSSKSLPLPVIKQRFPTKTAYDAAFEAAIVTAIKDGYVLAPDRSGILTYSHYPVG